MKKFYTLGFISFLFISAKAQFTNVQLDGGQSYGECTILINPKNTQQLVAGSNLNRVYYSSNGGTTWSVANDPNNNFADNGDPTAAIDTNGNFYFAHLHAAQDGNSCYQSTNGGATWNFRGNFGIPVGTNQDDKEWLLVDWSPNSPYKNTLYSTWADFDNYGSSSSSDSSRIMISKSTNGGTTWTNPVRLSRTAGNCGFNAIKGSVPAIGPNGELYITWCGKGISTPTSHVFFQKSLDGGATWMSQDKTVDTQVPTWYYTIPGFTYGTGFPGMATDVSGGTYNGNIYITWCDQRNGSNNTDVFLARSSDQGTTWTTTRVNNDLGQKHQSHPWVCVDQTTGKIYMVFYDRRNYTDNNSDVFVAWSNDGGASFSQTKINTVSATLTNGNLWTDYIGITAHAGKIHPIWSASSSTGVNEWTTTIDASQLLGIEEQQKKEENAVVLYQNYPNPFSYFSHFDFSLTKAGEVTLKIYDLAGREAATLINGQMYDAGMHNFSVSMNEWNLNPGIYFCVLSTPNGKDTRKFTVTQ